MKALILSIVTLFALGFTATTHAEMTTKNLAIGEITYQKGSWDIQITGTLPNPCLSAPRPLLIQSKNDPTQMVLTVVADGPKQMCAQVVRGPFKLHVNLRKLVQQSDVSIDDREIYTIDARNYPFSVKFEGRDVISFDVQPIAAAVQ